MNFKKIGLWGFFCMIGMVANGQINIKKDKTVDWAEPVVINLLRKNNYTPSVFGYGRPGIPKRTYPCLANP